MRTILLQALVALCVAALLLAAYERWVRQPRTPHLAVVDVAALYTAAERRATHATAERHGADLQEPTTGAARVRGAADFGPALQHVLQELSSDCRCTLVAMAAVFGADSTVPDLTAEAGRRLGLEVAP